MDDYRQLTVRGARRIDAKSRRPDKGHDAELQHFADAIQGLAPPAVTHEDGVRAAVCCLKLVESARTGQSLSLRSLSPMTVTRRDAGPQADV